MKQLISRGLLLLSILCLCITAVRADDTRTYETLEPGQAYPFSGLQSRDFEYTATADGRITMTASNDQATVSLFWYSPLDEEGAGPTVKKTGNEHKFLVKKGMTYQFSVYADSPTNVTLAFEDEASISLVINKITPAEGSALSLSDIETVGQVLLDCNFLGLYETVTISSGTKYSSVYNWNSERVPLSTVGIEIVKPMMELYDLGIGSGDPITISVTGLKDDEGRLYNGNGNLTLSYVAAAKPGDIVSNTFKPENAKGVLYSYYPEGGTEGVWTFTFTDPLKADVPYQILNENGGLTTAHDSKDGSEIIGPGVEISATSDNDACYKYARTTLSADRKTVTVDLRGYRFENMGGCSSYGVSFKLLNLFDDNGNMFLGQPDDGNAGSYGFECDYREYAQMPIESIEWSPGENSSLSGNSTISVTFDDRAGGTEYTSGNEFRRTGLVHSFTGVNFSGTGFNQTVPYSQCTVTTNGNNKTVSCAIPEGAKSVSNISVSLVGVEYIDGISRTEPTIKGFFNPANATGMFTSDPAPGSRVESIESIMIITDTDCRKNGDCTENITISGAFGSYQPNYINNYVEAGKNCFLFYISPKFTIDPAKVAEGFTKVSDGYELTVSVPANFFTNGTSYNAAETYTIIIGAPILDQAYDVTLSPTSGSEVYALSEITVSDGAYAVTRNGMAPSQVYLTTPSGAKVYPLSSSSESVLRFNEQTEPGTYTLTAPEGFFRMGDASDYRISAAIDAEFTVVPMTLVTNPAEGSTGIDGDAIDWYIGIDYSVNVVKCLDASMIYIEGHPEYEVEIEIEEDNRSGVVSKNQISWYKKDNSNDYVLPDGRYTFVFPAGSITVNGEANPVDIRLTYTFGEVQSFGITLPGYAEGGSYATIGHTEDDATFTITTPEDAPAIVAWDLFNTTDNVWIYGTTIDLADGTSYIPFTKLYQGKDYRLVIRGFEDASALNGRSMTASSINADDCITDITFSGTTPPFVYSSLTLSSASPVDGAVITTQAHFDNNIYLTFSGNVTVDPVKTVVIMPMGSDGEAQDPVAFESITGEGANWTLQLDPDAAYMTDYTGLRLRIVAYDSDNHQLRGDGDGRNLEENSHYILEYTLNNGADLIDVVSDPATGASVTNLASISITNADYNVAVNPDATTSVALSINGTSIPVNVTAADGVVTITPTSAITESGQLSLIIPERYLILDSKNGLGVKYNNAFTASYDHTYNAPLTRVDLDVTPGAGTVTEIKDFEFNYTVGWQPYNVLRKSGVALGDAYVTKPDGTSVAISSQEQVEFDGATHTILKLTSALTDAGTYTLVVPAGYFGVSHDYAEYENSAISLEYTIKDASEPVTIPVTSDPAIGSHNASLSTIVLKDLNGNPTVSYTTTSEGDLNLSFTVKNVTTGKTYKTHPICGWTFNGTLNMGDESGNVETLTEEGKYVITIPANYINVNGEDITEELELVYYIGDGNGEPDEPQIPEDPIDPNDFVPTTNPAVGSTVSSLSMIEFTNPSEFTWVNMSAYVDGRPGSIVNVNFNGTIIYVGDSDNNPYTAPGTYTIVIPAGNISVNGEATTQDTRLTYTVGVVETEFDLAVMVPANISANGGQRIEVFFPDMDFSKVSVNYSKSQAIEVSCKEDNVLYAGSYIYQYMHEKDRDEVISAYCFVPNVEALMNDIVGECTLTIPGEFFKYEDGGQTLYNRPFSITFIANQTELTDGVLYDSRINFTHTESEEITYRRTIPATGGWQAWFVPFDVTVSEMISAGYIAQNETDHYYEVLKFVDMVSEGGSLVAVYELVQPGETLEHNTPYLYIPALTGEETEPVEIVYTFSGRTIFSAPTSECKAVSKDGTWEFVGTYESHPMALDEYALSGGRFLKPSREGINLKPFRAYLRPKSTSTQSKISVRRATGSTTAIEALGIDLNDENLEIYNVQGQRVRNPQNGIYIINGQKIMIRR